MYLVEQFHTCTHAPQTLRHTLMRCMLSKLLFHSLSDMQCEPDVGGGGYPPDFSNYSVDLSKENVKLYVIPILK